MGQKENLKEYYKYLVFIFLFGFAGTVWGGITYFLGIPVAYLSFLKAGSTKIGLISTIFWAGFAIPQIIAAYKSESLQIKKRFVAYSLALSSIGFLAASMYIFVTGAVNPGLSTWMFLIPYGWACFVAGFYIPANFALLFKVIPLERLGQLLGIMWAIQFGGMFLSGFAIKAINNTFKEPMNYAVLFLITFIFTIIACVMILSLSEPKGKIEKTASSFLPYVKKFFSIYINDKPFTRFIISKWLMSGHYIMLGFLLYYFLNERGLDPGNVGWSSAMSGLGLFIGGFTITRIADAYGPKPMLITFQIISILYLLIAWLIPSTSFVVFIIAFIITGIAQVSDYVGYTNMTMFLCPSEDKSTYMAAVNIGVTLPMIFFPIIIGKLMEKNILSFNGIFILVFVMMIASILFLLTAIENPKAYLEMKSKTKSTL